MTDQRTDAAERSAHVTRGESGPHARPRRRRQVGEQGWRE